MNARTKAIQRIQGKLLPIARGLYAIHKECGGKALPKDRVIKVKVWVAKRNPKKKK